MEKTPSWAPASRWSPLYGVLGTLGFNAVWSLLMLVCWKYVGTLATETLPQQMLGIVPALALNYGATFNLAVVFLWSCVCTPLWEEAVFRWLPWRFLSRGPNGTARSIWPMVLVSGVLFGLAHRHGLFSLTIQGVFGLALATLWFRNGPNAKVSYFSCVAAHGLFNFIPFAIMLISR